MIAERRHRQWHDIEAEKEVFSECSSGHHGGQILVGSGQKTHIRVDRPVASDPLEVLFTQHAQDLHLHGGVDLADLIEEERPSGCLLKAPDASLAGSGEGPLLMAEELAFKKLRGEGGAMDGDKGFLGTRAQGVDRLCRDLLARAAFPLN